MRTQSPLKGRHWIEIGWAFLALLTWASVADAQAKKPAPQPGQSLMPANFKPRNADEAHAWRLLEQYKTSQQKRALAEAGIKQKLEDIRSVSHGMGGAFAIDAKDVAELQKMRDQSAAEKERCQKLEEVWSKKFWGRYGDLSDSNKTIIDAKTKKPMNTIAFRLVHFPFYVYDGVYSGQISGARGTITLTVNQNVVTGNISGTYTYTFLDEKYSDPFRGSVRGTLGNGGIINATISGRISESAFNGTLKGQIKAGTASGTWTAKAMTTATGSWKATRK